MQVSLFIALISFIHLFTPMLFLFFQLFHSKSRLGGLANLQKYREFEHFAWGLLKRYGKK
jgi:hypothetical protein